MVFEDIDIAKTSPREVLIGIAAVRLRRLDPQVLGDLQHPIKAEQCVD